MSGERFTETPENVVLEGDCVEQMFWLVSESVDAIVTDPPYDLLPTSRNGSRRINNPDNPAGRSARGFMGKTWDGTGVAFRPETWAAALRVAKPGAHLLAFGGTRTYHRMAVAIEDAGWEIRDCLVWAYASGFPKSLDVSKAIDKAAGHWRGKAGPVVVAEQPAKGTEYERTPKGDPVTAAAAAAAGWGTALKPAWEPIVMARKPLRGTVAETWMEHGTGALNIDGTRIPLAGPDDAEFMEKRLPAWGRKGEWDGSAAINVGPRYATVPDGRWPANVMLTDAIFDGDSEGVVGGGVTSGGGLNHVLRRGATTGAGLGYGSSSPEDVAMVGYDDGGTYSRFFLIPKADRSDRDPVLGGIEPRQDKAHRRTGVVDNPRLRGETFRANFHPTVKPTELMRHLVRLVTPPSGLVLDPFLGSGTTALAAEMEGFRWLGIEKEPEYVAIARARLLGTQRGLGLSA